MAYVGLGAADANYEFGIHAWDIAAGDLIVREAGGVVIDPAGTLHYKFTENACFFVIHFNSKFGLISFPAGGPLDLMSRRVLAASSIEIANDLSKLINQFYPEPRD